MSVNDETIRLNKSFEGYHKKLENGDCTAYQTPLGKSKLTGKMLYDIPTCGYGTTKNVKMGMVWTEAEATARMMQDLAEAEGYVQQYVTVPINENEKGALTLFCNNCGPKNLKRLVKRLNKGDRAGTAKAFALYNKAQGIVLDGLVSRRAREAALFLKPVEAPIEPAMPQTVQKQLEPPSAPAVAAGGGVLYTAWQYLGDKFNSFFDGLDQEQAMMLLGTAQKHGVGSAWINVLLCAAAGVGLYVLVGHVFPKLAGSKS
jgi:lysozyme